MSTDMDEKREEIRARLRRAASDRKLADNEKAKATAELTEALKEAADHGISHAESTRLGGVTRNGGYELLRKAGGGDR